MIQKRPLFVRHLARPLGDDRGFIGSEKGARLRGAGRPRVSARLVGGGRAARGRSAGPWGGKGGAVARLSADGGQTGAAETRTAARDQPAAPAAARTREARRPEAR